MTAKNQYVDGRKFSCQTCGKEDFQRTNCKNIYCSNACNPICRKGRTFSAESIAKMSAVRKGVHNSPRTEIKPGQRIGESSEFKNGHTPWHKGRTGVFSAESLRLMSINSARVWLGVKNPTQSAAWKGSNNPNWKGGVSADRHLVANPQYAAWRGEVFKRDGYSCQECGVRSKAGIKVVIHADHIKPWSLFPELRYDVTNGRTLCLDCHRATSTYGGRIRLLTRESF